MIAVCLLVLDGLDETRQQRVSVRYAAEHNLLIAALAHDPASALVLVRDHVAEAVLVAVEVAGGLVQEALGNVRVFYARRARVSAMADTEATLIRRALANSQGNVQLISELLGIPLREVQRLARTT